MKKITSYIKRNAGLCTLGLAAVVGSFSAGLYSTANVQPVRLIEAGSVHLRGDMNENGVLDAEDVELILEIAMGYTESTPKHLKLDPNDDGVITVDDALRVLSSLQ